MDPRILILLKVLDIASALFLRVSERRASDEAFVAKVRAIIVDKDGVPSDEDLATMLSESDAITARLEQLIAAK